MEILTPVLVGVLILAFLAIGATFSILYKRATKEVSFVRTGLGGEKVVMDGGAVVLPIFHDRLPVNMRTLRLEVVRRNEEALITSDRMRVDVTAEFFVRVRPESSAIAKAAQTLGQRTMEPEKLKDLLQGKFIDSLRSVAAGMSMEQLHEQRADFVQSVQSSLSEDLVKNGLELESVSLTALDQTSREHFKDDNAFDAQGLAKLTSITEARREERNRIEQDTRIKVEEKDLEADMRSLEIKRDQEMADLNQKREVEFARASQESLVARERAQRRREAEESRFEEERKEKEAGIASEQAVREREIIREQSVKAKDIEAKRDIEEMEIQRKQAVEIRSQVAAINVAEKSREQSAAEANAAKARGERVREEEKVITVKATAEAERAKQIELIKAQEGAERDAIGIKVAAEADKRAALDRAEAVTTEAKAAAEKIRLVAEADQRRLEVEAVGLRAINEAKNLLEANIIAFELRKLFTEHAADIIAASVKPMEKIDSIRIVSAPGIMGGNHRAGGDAPAASNGEGGLPNQLVSALMQYRMQIPVVDQMLKDIGFDPANPGRISPGAETVASAGEAAKTGAAGPSPSGDGGKPES
ncbi:MAG: hypothetical protein JJU00_17230 [Opitutales bacterium]|nr:hypothetical protein [Opitutales bacterium]